MDIDFWGEATIQPPTVSPKDCTLAGFLHPRRALWYVWGGVEEKRWLGVVGRTSETQLCHSPAEVLGKSSMSLSLVILTMG